MQVAAAGRLAAYILPPPRMRQAPSSHAPACGFTLVELVVVLTLIGIVAAIGLGRYADSASFATIAFADRTAGMLRYGQKLAVAQNRPVYVVADGNKVALCFDVGCAMPVVAPSGSNGGSDNTKAKCGNTTWECEAPPNGVSFTSISSFYFSPLGEPFLPTDGATSNFATLTITVSGGGSSKAFVVEHKTGYVH